MGGKRECMQQPLHKPTQYNPKPPREWDADESTWKIHISKSRFTPPANAYSKTEVIDSKTEVIYGTENDFPQ
jgi:hypothetical protein